MRTVFTFRPKEGTQPLYVQLADYFRNEIRAGNLQPKDFLPSIRKLNKDLKLSRTTAEKAYSILIDQGYIHNLPNRGYQVADYVPVSEEREAQPEKKAAVAGEYLDELLTDRQKDAEVHYDPCLKDMDWIGFYAAYLKEVDALAG